MARLHDPKHSIVAEKLKQVTIEAFHGANRDNLTLKSVREKVETVLGLEHGILRRKDWKDESKAIVEQIVQQLLEAEEKEQKQSECDQLSDNDSLLFQTHYITSSFRKNTSKKCSQQNTDDVTSRRKRLKNKKFSTCGESRANDSCDSSSSEQEFESIINSHGCNTSKFKSVKLASSLPGLKVELGSGDDMIEEQKFGGLNSYKINHISKSPIQETGCVMFDKVQEKVVGESRVKDEHNDTKCPPLELKVENSKEKDTIESKIRPNPVPVQQTGTEESLISRSIVTDHDLTTEKDLSIRQDEAEEALDSDMSMVIDEEPPEKARKKKRQKRDAREIGRIAPKNNKKLSSDEEMLKKLQSQLRKCGIKTIWHFELKEYGEDTRAKIRHLQKALKDIGMQGRFSEARAREIKESRELMADLEAVKEGDMKWGLKRYHKYEQNEKDKKVSIYENSKLEVESDDGKEEFRGKSLRNKNLKRKSSFTVQQPRRRSNALDWLGGEESSEG